MPKAWSEKDERQYEHVKQEARARGRTSARANEIAARIVNKQRREEGRTPNRTTQGTGNPNTPSGKAHGGGAPQYRVES